jgi:arylformamidase
MSMGVHTGTHVDAPFHFVSGAATIESLAMDVLIGIAQVVEVDRAVGLITEDVLRSATINPGVSVCCSTRNSDLWARGETRFQKDFVALSEDAALYLVDGAFNWWY